MINVAAIRMQQFGVQFYQASLTASDIDKLVRFEVLSYGEGGQPGVRGGRQKPGLPPPSKVNWDFLERRIASSGVRTMQLEGDRDPAACFAESLAVFRKINAEGEQARTLRAWAEFDLREGRTETGRARAHEARTIFLRLAATPEVFRTDALLA